MSEPTMPTVRIGPTGRPCGVLGLGCWQFGQSYWAGQTDEASLSAMAAALQAGMNHSDTAEGYGKGRSERLVGRFLAEKRPLVELAIRWVASRGGAASVLVAARDAEQVRANAAAMAGEVPEGTLEAVTAVGDEVMRHVPDVGNMFRFYP
jgi:aryl-alcohol dehydrogenase-like predicted oxidoreductase